MKHINGLILCEGETDKILISYYLLQLKGWKYKQINNDMPFVGSSISWYCKNQNDAIGIWPVGGNEFNPSIEKIINLETIEHSIDKIVIITDHDDNIAEKDRLLSVLNTIKSNLKVHNFSETFFLEHKNEWIDILFKGQFDKEYNIKFCYLLVPQVAQGALETFMLNALSEHNFAKKEVVDQATNFIETKFTSKFFLTKRREKIKATFGVAFSIFCPDKIFSTMNELLTSVDWSKFDTTKNQFQILCDI